MRVFKNTAALTLWYTMLVSILRALNIKGAVPSPAPVLPEAPRGNAGVPERLCRVGLRVFERTSPRGGPREYQPLRILEHRIPARRDPPHNRQLHQELSVSAASPARKGVHVQRGDNDSHTDRHRGRTDTRFRAEAQDRGLLEHILSFLRIKAPSGASH